MWDLKGLLSLEVYDLNIFQVEVDIMEVLFWNKMVNLFEEVESSNIGKHCSKKINQYYDLKFNF